MRFLTIALVLFLPAPTLAAVIINEVAWMGSSASANHEWIELYNTGNSVSVDGWTVSDGMNLTITLTGTIPSNSYAVLERTSDDSAPGSAFFIYTGALVNTGATLTLKRADGGIEDQIGGGENWLSIGGDNTTKETAQYTTSGWITAVGTPGQANRTSGSTPTPVTPAPPSTDNPTPSSPPTTQPPSRRNRDSSETVRMLLPANTLALTVDAQAVGYVNQGISFSATPSGIGRTLAHSIVYRWNFGDGTVAFGKEPTHHYQFPGTYVVTLYASVGTQEHLSRHEITILPISVSLSRGPSGEVQVNNDSPYEIDLSGYRVNGADDFVFPEYTILLPNQTITLAQNRLGLTDQTTLPTLYDSLEQPILRATSLQRLGGSPVEAPSTEIITPLKPVTQAHVVSAQSRFGFATTTPAATKPAESEAVQATTTPVVIPLTASTSSVSSANPANQQWPYYVLVVLLLGALGVIFYKPNGN